MRNDSPTPAVRIRILTETALFSAIGILAISLVRLMPTGDMLLFLLASLTVALGLCRGGLREAGLIFAVTSVVILFYPGLPHALGYWFFFGLYPMFKAFIERFRLKRWQEWSLKFLFAGLILGIVAIILSQFFGAVWSGVASRFQLDLVWVKGLWGGGGLVLFALYDYCLSVLIFYVQRRLRH